MIYWLICRLTMSMDLYYMALRHTSATFASTTTNMIPGFTFLIAIIFRYLRFVINTYKIFKSAADICAIFFLEETKIKQLVTTGLRR